MTPEFDFKTAARLIRGEDEDAKCFAHDALFLHETVLELSARLDDLQRLIAARETEIEVLEAELLKWEITWKPKDQTK